MWHSLTREERLRPPSRDVRITNVRSMGIKGNPKAGGDHHIWGIVKVETDAGVFGIAETYRGREAMTLAEQFGEQMVDENPLDPARVGDLLAAKYTGAGTVARSAITAIETACWDIKGKIHELPVWELLGGKYRDRVRIYSDADALARRESDSEEHTPAAIAAAAEDVVEQGFDAIKFDLDVPTPDYRNPDTAARRLEQEEIDHKVELVRAAREAIGQEVDLGMDLHWKFTVETAVRLGRRLEPFDLAFLEDPVHPAKLDAQRRVQRAVDIPILTGENTTNPNEFQELLSAGVVDLAAPDMARCGGLSTFREIAQLCDHYGVPMAPHNLASPVGTIAAVHAAVSVPNFYRLEYRGGDAPWWHDLITRSDSDESILAGDEIPLPTGHGLGIKLDPEIAQERLLPDAEYIF